MVRALPTATPTTFPSPVPTPVPTIWVPQTVPITPIPTFTLPSPVPIPVTPVPTITIQTVPITTLGSPTPNPTSTPGLVAHPSLRHLEEKRYMLQLINTHRAEAGTEPLVLGDNVAAQLHAETAKGNCISSHWGIDGLKSVMRYSLAGGYQSNSENVNGLDYCYTSQSGVKEIGSIEQEIEDAVDGLMASAGHRETILTPEYRMLNVGLAWDRYILWVVQVFEGDYVEYSDLPAITDGVLTLTGTVKNGVSFLGSGDLIVGIFYDPPPALLTRGQIARTYCSRQGPAVAFLRRPIPENRRYTEDEFTRSYAPCLDPHDVPADTPPPRSPGEAVDLWRAAYEASKARPATTITRPWVTATEWIAQDSDFSVKADLSEVIADHGAGVYTILVWGWLPETSKRILISEYSIFHDVTVPDTYDPVQWNTLQ